MNANLRFQAVAVLLCVGSWLALPASANSIWLDPEGLPSSSARDALKLLAEAQADGLSAKDYGLDRLSGTAGRSLSANGDSPAGAERFARELDASFLHYLHDLKLGRVDPTLLHFKLPSQRPHAPDFVHLVQAAALAGNLPAMVAELRPNLGQYDKLREALARYRTLAADASLGRLPVAPAAVKPGEPYAATGELNKLLIALGDLPTGSTPTAQSLYTAPLVEGVKHFQARHGLTADGVIGKTTFAALNVPLARRVQQLELALERLRWLPDLTTQPFVGINIPMFRLWTWDPAQPATPPLSMGVVVGRALNTQTPVLQDDMRYLIFQPYWNVPRSILRKEILPHLARDPGYLRRQNMELVRGASDNAAAVETNDENLALLRKNVLRVRQRAGPHNALGRVKFIFPNDDNVYLHDTPSTQLFSRARRDFSHGCVRVERPAALAQWVLRDQAAWTRERIDAAMASTSMLRVDLPKSLPVVLFYMTAMVMPEDNALHFSDDLYGHDAQLARALEARRPD